MISVINQNKFLSGSRIKQTVLSQILSEFLFNLVLVKLKIKLNVLPGIQ